MSDKCPQCGGELNWLAGAPAHETNRYCENEQECGWQAWDKNTWATKPTSKVRQPTTTHFADDATLARIAELERENAELRAEIENLLHTIARYQADAGSSARMKIADNDKTGAAQFRAVELALDLVHKDCSLQVAAIASEKEAS